MPRDPRQLPASMRPSAAVRPPVQPLDDAELDALQALLEAVPGGGALDIVMLDGYLCGVLLQPRRVPPATCLRFVLDPEGRPLPPGADGADLQALVLRRHAELDDAIERRAWFDPWIVEPEAVGVVDAEDEADADADDAPPPAVEAVFPWVAGFAFACEHFPELTAMDDAVLNEPLALLYRHLGPDDLEDADALLAEIESLEPPADLDDAVEGLVRATLLLADLSRPLRSPLARSTPKRAAPKRRSDR